MATDPEDDFYFTYCGADWKSLSDKARDAISAVAQAAHAELKRRLKEDEDEDLA